ncbi:5528_t:CDS:2 [Racocetra persica]|uniref:5528_t:CDS:1 n=1 Tax=Racocetra persica TaxID=160502 RepID=A0ACA9LJH8_9GLOM|nr:5528_t:CDS:2 [Racocetra persica]
MSMTAGKIITPTKLPEVIGLSVVNSSRFIILGTKPEAPHVRVPDIVIDLLPTFNEFGYAKHSSLLDYIIPTHHPNPDEEPVRLEFRPANPKTDENSDPYFRITVKRGSKFSEIFNELKDKWDSVVYPNVWDNLKHLAALSRQYLEDDHDHENSPPYSGQLKSVVVDQK